jgi:TadE-like protein
LSGEPSRFHRVGSNESGSALVEAALITPMFLLLCLGLVDLGFLGSNYISLASATSLGVHQFALDTPAPARSGPAVPVSSTPYSDLQSTLKANARLLSALNPVASLTSTGGITIQSVCVYPSGQTCASGGTTCNSDTSCGSALLGVSTGGIATVTTSYPCFVAFKMFGFEACTLTASVSARLQ